ncbi:helix-turn-helix transcriptional regulator [Gordonia sp. TBRC 11910]|uniref:Helix-turn-helix transcriptional regulator n=1 Tax=Gordonia asplenii TaxID=2725283 RepID=A0A848KVZ5_9ACTN|nr:helix-turn-helix domain-containing protein [Gordonia asplenii]NMO03024.1 helix-turn-helix transcriptional regulator [Gordonia asplenii]
MRSYDQYCSVAKALDVVGDRWTLLIVRELLLQGGSRYADLVRGLPGISTNLLAERLKTLEAQGLVARYDAPPPIGTTLYELTDAGRDLEPVIRSLVRFGARYMAAPTSTETFRSHWLAFPISELLDDADPTAPPVVVEARVAEAPAFIEIADGEIRTTLVRPSTPPSLTIEGNAQLALGLLTRQVDVELARQLGLGLTGDLTVLQRLRFNGPHVVDDPADLASER